MRSAASGGIARRMVVVALLLVVAAGSLGYVVRSQASAKQGDCGAWADDTAGRIEVARQLVMPAERQEQSTGSVQGDAQALYDLAQEQANSDPPDVAYNLHGDLIEAMAAASEALSGGGVASAESQIVFAKGVVYNADLRLNAVADAC
jgi:hypothetical protein